MTVRLTVTLGVESSGYSRTRRPLARLYSVTPSMERTFFGRPGSSPAETALAGIRTARPTRSKSQGCLALGCGEHRGCGLFFSGSAGDGKRALDMNFSFRWEICYLTGCFP